MTVTTMMLGTRAVVRPIEAGSEDIICPAERGGCGAEVKFQARVPSRFRLRVVANVYWQGRWNRVEQWHLFPCYLTAGMPYGAPVSGIAEELLSLMTDVLGAFDAGADRMAITEALVAEARARKDGMNIVAPRRP
jgi:hypothetical protein